MLNLLFFSRGKDLANVLLAYGAQAFHGSGLLANRTLGLGNGYPYSVFFSFQNFAFSLLEFLSPSIASRWHPQISPVPIPLISKAYSLGIDLQKECLQQQQQNTPGGGHLPEQVCVKKEKLGCVASLAPLQNIRTFLDQSHPISRSSQPDSARKSHMSNHHG